MKIRDQIKEFRRVPAKDILPNPKNWRVHSDAQANALRGVLAEVGWADAVLVMETEAGLQLIDGHLRIEVAPDAEIPVLVLDVSQEKTDKILATHDPFTMMAEADAEKLEELLKEIETDSEAMVSMLDQLKEEVGISPPDFAPRGKLVKLGCWEDDFIGSVIFSMGASAQFHKRYGLDKLQVCELTRIALKEHKTPVSRIGSIAVKMLKKLCPKLRLIVSFADPFQGHTGKIYQAMNWIYSGQSARASVWIDQRGKLWHNRNVSDEESRGGDGWGTRMHSKKGMRKEIREGKHRYILPLDKKLRIQLESLRLEYPKICVAGETG